MFRKVLMLMAIVFVFSAYEVQAVVIHSTWVGDYGVWGDANNWNPAIVPDNNELDTFVVKIEGYSNGPDIGLLQSRTVNQLDCYGTETIYLASWKGLPVGSPISVILTLEDPNGLTNHGDLAIGELDVRGNVNNLGDLEIEVVEIVGNVTNTTGARLGLGNTEIEGNLYNQAGATIDVDYEVDVEQGVLENAGLIEIAPTGEIYVNTHFNNIGEILIYGGDWGVDEGILDNNSTGVIRGFGVLFVEQLLRNKGRITAFGGSLTIVSFGPIINSGLLANKPSASLHITYVTAQGGDVNNQGTIEVNAGGGVSFDCNLVNEPNATIQLLGGTLAATTITQSANANFVGFGGITGDVVIEPGGEIDLTGPTNIVGNVTIDPNATLEISDGTTLITGHTICNNGTIHMIGGRVICQGGLTNNNCNIIWEPGTYTNMADFNLDGTVNFKDFADFGDTWLWQADWYTP